MTRRLARFGLMLGTLAVPACGGSPQAPAPLPQTGRPSAGPTPSPTPAPTPSPGNHPFEGTYALTLEIGSGCTAVPETERTRHYTAQFSRVAEGSYVISLSDATFLRGSICDFGSGRFAGIGCHQFFAYDDGVQMQFALANNNDEAHGGHIVEQTASGTWLEIIGEAVGARNPSSMDAAGRGSVWRCPGSPRYPYPCSSFVFCDSTELRLRLTRR